MSYDRERRQIFLYHVYANGCGGVIRRNSQILAIPTIGSNALTAAGGRTRTEAGPFSWSPPFEPPTSEGGFYLSVDGITTELWTEENDGEWVSNAEVRVSGFNLCDRVKVGLMVNRLTSRHPKGLPEERATMTDGGQPLMSFAGSQYWNVTIDDVPVHITVDHDLERCLTHNQLRTTVVGDSGSGTPYCPRNLEGPPDYMDDLRRKFVSPHYTRCSIVGEVRHEKANGYSVDLTDSTNRAKNLGRVFFGEMIAGDDLRHLTMLRWDLGCDTSGDGMTGGSSMNGLPMP